MEEGRYTDEFVMSEVALYLEGQTMREVAATLGSCPATVYKHLSLRLKELSYRDYLKCRKIRKDRNTQLRAKANGKV